MPGWYDDGSEEEHQMRQAARKAEKALERELASREGENIEDNADVRMVRPLDRDVLGSEEADALSVSTANAGTTNNLLETAERPEQTALSAEEMVKILFPDAFVSLSADQPTPEQAWEDAALRLADRITACNNYEALRKSHAALMEQATVLLDAMETCHICQGALLLQEEAVHCEDCSVDCENHEEPECTPIYVLHRSLRKSIANAKALTEGL